MVACLITGDTYKHRRELRGESDDARRIERDRWSRAAAQGRLKLRSRNRRKYAQILDASEVTQ